MPTSGLVFYAPLTTDIDDEFNLNMSTMGTVETNQNVDGINCVKLNNGSLIYATSSENLPSGSSDVTLSIWYKQINNDFSSPQMFFHVGNQSTGQSFEMGVYQNHWHWNILKNPYEENFGTPDNDWHHMLILRDSSSGHITMYIDGVIGSDMSNAASQLSIQYGNLIFGSRSLSTNNCTTKGCYITAARIYNRVLNQEEIALLASEFTPTITPIFNNQSIEFDNDTGATSKTLVFDSKGITPTFTITSGTLPTGVTFNSSTGTFTYDGTTISSNQDYALTIQLSGDRLETTTATITLQMRVEAPPIPTSGMVFYASLTSSSASTAETGQALTYSGTAPTTATISGIQCLYFNSNGYITAPDTGLSFGSSNATVSVWVYTPETRGYWSGCLGYGTHSTKKCIRIALQPYNNDISAGFEMADIGSGIYATTGWHHAALVRDGDNAKLYVDGVLKASDVFSGIDITSNGNIYIASQTNGSSTFYLKGYLAAARIYNRALTDSEVALLASEFTPTT